MKIKSQDYEKFHKKLEDFCRYPMNLNDKFRLLLATTLRDDGLPDEREFDNQVINFTRVNHWRLIHFNFRISSFRKIVLTLLIYEIVYQLLYELFVGMVFSYAQHFFFRYNFCQNGYSDIRCHVFYIFNSKQNN